jgi:dTDP-4-amino-4,6-dideoxygalactose transaminase
MSETLAIFGGPKAVTQPEGDLFKWPIITEADEAAVLDVLRRGAMSELDVTKAFESEFAAWQGTELALAFNNGTAALHAAMFACGVGEGDEVICPSVTYWASGLPAFGLGAKPVYADIDPVSLCLDANDIEHRITPRTKALVDVHYFGHPADMDPILAIARRRGVKVIEDVSHAQGGRYRGRMLGTLGDVGAMSLMSGKSFATGEGGILVTNDRSIWEKSIAFGHYERFNRNYIESPDLLRYAGLPLGGVKYRMHQLSSAVGRVQLKSYDARAAEIRRAMNHFWDLLEGVPGVRAHRVDEAATGSNMAGWYAARGHYVPEELGGLSISRFAEAVRAEGAPCYPGSNPPLHRHPLMIDRGAGAAEGSLPVSERTGHRTYQIPWFKKYYPEQIAEYAAAYRKVAENYRALLTDDTGDPATVGAYSSSRRG